jgi:hypothetical protein
MNILLALALLAADGQLFLNGVSIDGLRSQEFSNAIVRIDERGRVYIIAPDYAVAPPAEHVRLKAARVAAHESLLLIFESRAVGKTKIKVEVVINGKTVLSEADPMQSVNDVTQHLVAGENVVEVRLSRVKGVGAMHAVIGLGTIESSQIKLTQSLVDEDAEIPANGMKVYHLPVKR